MTIKCITVLVRGRVQGVFFRDSTQIQARQLNITGYAKNLDDGQVEVLACGSQASIDLLIDWLHHGPEYARVDELKIEDVDSKIPGSFTTR